MNSVLSDRHFHDEAAAYGFVEARVWPNGPFARIAAAWIGLQDGRQVHPDRRYKCYQCRKPFTVKVGTVFEASHVPMRLWLQAMFLLARRKKGICANQLHRTLGVTLKTAWFMSHRIREAMRDGGLAPLAATGRSSRSTRPISASRRSVAVAAAQGPALPQAGKRWPSKQACDPRAG